MTLEYARELLGGRAIDNAESLQERYRALLKKYQPARYQENREFCTIMTGRITQAYQLLAAELQRTQAHTAPSERKRTERVDRFAHQQNRESGMKGHSQARPLYIATAYRPYIHTASEAICHYYSYDLPNVYLRDSGNTRTHFKVVQNKLSALLKVFERHIVRSDDRETDAHQYFLFCKAFFDNIQSELRIRTSLSKAAYKLLKIYRECTAALDTAIERRYCNPDMDTPSIDGLSRIRNNFQQLIEEDEQLGFRGVAIIKHDLADAFVRALHWSYRD